LSTLIMGSNSLQVTSEASTIDFQVESDLGNFGWVMSSNTFTPQTAGGASLGTVSLPVADIQGAGNINFANTGQIDWTLTSDADAVITANADDPGSGAETLNPRFVLTQDGGGVDAYFGIACGPNSDVACTGPNFWDGAAEVAGDEEIGQNAVFIGSGSTSSGLDFIVNERLAGRFGRDSGNDTGGRDLALELYGEGAGSEVLRVFPTTDVTDELVILRGATTVRLRGEHNATTDTWLESLVSSQSEFDVNAAGTLRWLDDTGDAGYDLSSQIGDNTSMEGLTQTSFTDSPTEDASWTTVWKHKIDHETDANIAANHGMDLEFALQNTSGADRTIMRERLVWDTTPSSTANEDARLERWMMEDGESNKVYQYDGSSRLHLFFREHDGTQSVSQDAWRYDCISDATGGNPLSGFGCSAEFGLDDAGGATENAALRTVSWNNVTNETVNVIWDLRTTTSDTLTRFSVMNGANQVIDTKVGTVWTAQNFPTGTTPDVKGGTYYQTANGSPVTVTSFTNLVAGQVFTISCGSVATTFADDDNNIELTGDANFVCGQDDSITFIGQSSGTALEMSRSDKGAGGANPANIFFAYDSAGNTAILNTATVIPLGTNPENDAAFGAITGGNTVPIDTTGRYRVDGNVTVEILNTGGNLRGSFECYITDSGSKVNYCASGTYTRETTNRFGCTFSCVHSFTNTDTVQLVAIRTVNGNATNIDTIANYSTLTMEYID
jgi:hypothetical protein